MGESASLTVPNVSSDAYRGRGCRPAACLCLGVSPPRLLVFACEYAIVARDAGADALMVLPPLNYNGDIHEIAAFYEAVARLPVFR